MLWKAIAPEGLGACHEKWYLGCCPTARCLTNNADLNCLFWGGASWKQPWLPCITTLKQGWGYKWSAAIYSFLCLHFKVLNKYTSCFSLCTPAKYLLSLLCPWHNSSTLKSSTYCIFFCYGKWNIQSLKWKGHESITFSPAGQQI